MSAAFFPALRQFVEQRVAEFDVIPTPRKRELREIASFVATCLRTDEPARLTFICTHNSRRSHLSQIWAAVAADYYQVTGVETYSGGTEATAVAPQAIAALQRAGFIIESPPDRNPRHAVRSEQSGRVLTCFSKVYNEAPNPRSGYCAVMTCSHADANCPVIEGASTRIAVQYDDPKNADGTPTEAATYDERCRQIAREMLYAFSQVER